MVYDSYPVSIPERVLRFLEHVAFRVVRAGLNVSLAFQSLKGF